MNTQQTKRIYNWKPSPEDRRDLKSIRHLNKVNTALPEEFELPFQIPVYNQLSLGSCTSNSGCACFRFEAAQLVNNFDFEPSRLFLYYNTRLIEGTVDEDSGAYIRDVFKALNKYGLAHEKYFPYDVSKFTQKPSLDALNDGLKNIVIKYTSVAQNENVIKQTLLDGAAISFGFTVYESFEYGDWDSTTGVMPLPKKKEKILGGHAVTIIGWSNAKKCFLIQNSWGEEWGIKGKFWMPYSFLLNPKECDDFWCIDKIKLDTQTPEPIDQQKIELDFAIKLFTNREELKRLKKTILVKLGHLLNVPTNNKYNMEENLNIVCEKMGFK